MRTARLVSALALVALLAPLPALAASQGTARASGDIPVRSGPGGNFRVIGTLADGTRVRLERCTRESNWCLFIGDDGEPAGWVRGSYIVGSGAKNEVTPHEFLYDPIRPFFLRDRDDDED